MADEAVPTAAQLRKLRVVDLRKRLQALELTQSGNKEDLISRLRQYYLDQQAKQASAKEEEEVKEEEELVVEKSDGGQKVVGEGGGAEGDSVREEGRKSEISVGEEEDVKASGVEGSVGGGEMGVGGVGRGGGERVGGEGDGLKVRVEDMQTDTAQRKTDTTPDTEQETTTDDVTANDITPIADRTRDVTEGVVEADQRRKEREPLAVSGSGIQSQPESIAGSTQSMDQTVPSADVHPLPSTSDYYSDSAREETSHSMPGNPQIAQDSISIVPPSIVTPLMMTGTSAVVPSNQASSQAKKDQEPKGKKKKKKRRRRRHNQGTANTAENEPPQPDVEIEYVQEDLLKPGDAHYRQFHKIFENFKITDDSDATPKATPIPEDDSMSIAAKSAAAQKKQRDEEAAEQEEEKPKEPAKLSKKKLRKLNRLTVAQLKQLVDRPDVVEMHDVTAQDPKLLIHLKSTRNTVPVPRHWCFKRKYLQGKRGIEKPPFNLPDFIKATGIMEMRQALEEKEDAKSLKQKTRERVRPKMGKLTIDYQKLHDAFFRWQTKPKMTIHGDLYYEGKEFETRLREKKPGDLSDDLRRALGMPTGMGAQKFPPPWLVAMQRYGPPPSYPNLKIPGLNAPIPEGCSFGYFVGGWGKPPVDEVGRPLYGDVFGLDQQENAPKIHDEDIDKQLWGELESEEEMDEEEESEGEGEGEMKAEDLQAGLITPIEGGLVTPSGLTSIPAGLETPEMIQLRKKKIEEAMEQGGDTPALYTVLPEKSQAVGGAVMGSSHVYDMSAAVPGAGKKAGGGATGEGVEVALDPSELDLDAATMTARYEEQLKETKLQKEDLSDMVAEHAAKQKKRKRPATDSSSSKASKKLKEFKF